MMQQSLYKGSYPIYEVRVGGTTVEWTDKIEKARAAYQDGMATPRELLAMDFNGRKTIVEKQQ